MYFSGGNPTITELRGKTGKGEHSPQEARTDTHSFQLCSNCRQAPNHPQTQKSSFLLTASTSKTEQMGASQMSGDSAFPVLLSGTVAIGNKKHSSHDMHIYLKFSTTDDPPFHSTRRLKNYSCHDSQFMTSSIFGFPLKNQKAMEMLYLHFTSQKLPGN